MVLSESSFSWLVLNSCLSSWLYKSLKSSARFLAFQWPLQELADRCHYWNHLYGKTGSKCWATLLFLDLGHMFLHCLNNWCLQTYVLILLPAFLSVLRRRVSSNKLVQQYHLHPINFYLWLYIFLCNFLFYLWITEEY